MVSPTLGLSISLVCLTAEERELSDQLNAFADFGSEDYRNARPSIALKGRVYEAYDMEIDTTQAVFHSICSVGAHSLSSTTPQSSKYNYLALCHENLAIHHLQRCISNGCTSYIALATTIMYLCLGDQVARRTRWLWEHTQAGIRCLLLSLPDDGQMHNYTASICGQYLFLGLLKTDLHSAERRVILTALFRSLGANGHQRFLLDLQHMDFLFRIHEIASGMSPYQSPEMFNDLQQQLDELEPAVQPVTRENRIRRVVHQASRVVFARLHRHAQPEEVDSLVATFLNYLEKLQNRNNESQNNQVANSIMMVGMFGTQRLARHHEERLMTWLRGRFGSGLGHVNFAVNMMDRYWERQRHTQHNTSPTTGVSKADQEFPDALDHEVCDTLALHHFIFL